MITCHTDRYVEYLLVMDARDEVKSKLSIEDVISSYLELKRAGRNWKALSPFTNERTASFIVSPEKQIWHDFSSGKGGDVFSFVMEVEGLDFRGALELLARRAGVDLSKYEDSSKRRSSVDKNRLYSALELATKFYQVQFSKNKGALDYIFKTRKFTKETALTWQIGYSPNNGDALIKFLKGKGFSDKEIKLSGLSAVGRGGTVDMFRSRLMIPLSDSQGRVIGFTARLLGSDSHGPKYINTPVTPLYDKSRHVFGLHLAKAAIRESSYVVVVEGNMDVIASNQAGVKQVVATAGTALTTYQLRDLSRLTDDVRLCFDADKAGVSATERAIPLASSIKINLSVITLGSGKDPDELIRNNVRDWSEVVTKPTYAIDWLIDHHKNQLDLTKAQDKRKFTDKLLPIVSSLEDEVEKDHYINRLAKLTGVSPMSIGQKMTKSFSPKIEPKKSIKITNQSVDKDKVEEQKVQNQFLALMLERRTLRDLLKLVEPTMINSDEGKELLKILLKNPELDDEDSSSYGKNLITYVKIERLLYEELYSSLDLNELHYEAERLRSRLIEIYVKKQKSKIARELEKINMSNNRELLEQAKDLDRLLNEVKGKGF